MEEVFKGNRPTTHFNKLGWRNIEANFKKNTSKEYPRIKFKHKWDILKKDWVAWNKLKRISIPLSLIRQPTVETFGHSDPFDEPKVLLLEGFNDLGSSDDNNLGSEGDEDEEDEVSVV